MEVAQIRVDDGTFQKYTVNKWLGLQKLNALIYKTLKEELRRNTET